MKRDKQKLEDQWNDSQNHYDWDNFKIDRDIYVDYLFKQKVAHFKHAIGNCGKDSRKIHNTLNGLLNRRKEAALPDMPPQECADSLANYFLDKIMSIREPPAIYSASHNN